MSGNNANGYGESRRFLLGLGDLYIDNVFVGNLKGAVALNITRNYAFQRAGNNIADQKGEVTSEEVMLTAEIMDLKVSQLRRALGIDQAVLTAQSTFELRKREVLTLTGIAVTEFAETSNASGSIRVTSLDRQTVYAETTDWILSGLDAVKRNAAGAIADGEAVIVEYDFNDDASSVLQMGGETKTPNTFEMVFTHQDSTGKLWQVKFFKAMVNTDFSMAFNERESGDYTVHNASFKALIDVTKKEGLNLLEIVQEDA